ncbi:hypothetical protein [Ferruginibacter albus]|uniref:hypothetical protein n=1 Tax=Ferruginibacter albus TaxID=2875540 RepID=UPI0028F42845|nr:hypothetical protein [Ferruginibacter albus]
MSNHIHLIWQSLNNFTPTDIQHSLLSYTAHQIQLKLQKESPSFLNSFKVKTKDRAYQFWEREALGIDLYTHDVFIQKLNYLHYNPVKAGLCIHPEEYLYSSYRFYETGVDVFNILSNYAG